MCGCGCGGDAPKFLEFRGYITLFPGLLQGEKIGVVSHGPLFIIQYTSAPSRSVRTVQNTVMH